MLAHLYNNTEIVLANCSPHEDDLLTREFSVSSPGISYIDPGQAGIWDGVYRFYNRKRQVIARPLLSKLREACAKHGLPLTVRDNRDPDPYPPPDPETIGPDFMGDGITLDPWQVRAIRKACTTEVGTFDYPTGGGKGEIIAGICKAILCPTVILADQTVVIDQLKARLELRSVVEEVGVFYAGRRPNGELIAVGSIQSLMSPTKIPQKPVRTDKDNNATWARKEKNYEIRVRAHKTRLKNARLLQQLVKKAHMLLVDECDKATSKPYQSMFRHVFKGRRRYGFSGTMYDPSKPVEAMRLQQHLGSVIARESRRTVEDAGRIIPVELIMMAVEGDPNERSTYDIAYREHMVESQRFHSLVTGIARMYPDDGTLILVDREELGWNLQRAFGDMGIDVPFIYGKTPKRRRTEVLRAFERRDYKVVIGGKIINRGLDLNGGCENLILATGGKLWSDFNQKVGRAVRHNRRGRGRVFDFYFRCNKYLYDHSRARLKAMVGMGYRTTVVFGNGRVDGESLIESRFRVTKRLLAAGGQRNPP